MKDNVKPVGPWKFNKEVASCFSNMLERSIPDYRSMRALVDMIGAQFVKPGTLIVDVGCSTGIAVEPFVSRYHNENTFLLIDNSPAMIDECRKKFKDIPSVGVQEGNLWEYLPFEGEASLILSVLSMQFMPTSYRKQMLQDIYDSMTEGGAFIFVEKVVSKNLDSLMVDLYYEMKQKNGYTMEQIADKRRSLENVLSPLEPEWNESMLKDVGFREVEMFWRCLNFCGWVAVK